VRQHGRKDSDQWCSPRDVAEPLAQFFGGPVGCDPCSNANSIIVSEISYTWGGLHLPWRKPGSSNRTAYMNNPYSINVPWAGKALYEMRLGNVHELVTLMMVAPSTAWWSDLCRAPRNPRLLFTSRLRFIGDSSFGARFDTVLKYFGRRHRAFDREFQHITRWTSWGR